MDSNEKELMANLKRGDRIAFDELVKRYRGMLYSVIYRMVTSHSQTDELLQETFLKLYLNAKKYDDRYPFYPWLRRIAVNTAINYIKQESKRRQDHSLDRDMEERNFSPAAENDYFSPEVTMVKKERDLMILRALKALSPLYRTPLVLRVYEGMSYKDLSQVLDCNMGTVMSRLNRARQQLKDSLKDFIG